MDLDFEQCIVFNAAFGASTLWNFVSGYCAAHAEAEGPDFPLTQIVLPLAYHQRTATALERTAFSGGFLRALDRVPDLAAELSERVEDLSAVTAASLNLATASGLLLVEPSEAWPCFVPGRKHLPPELKPSQPHLAASHATARRLGQWTARERRDAIWAYLDLRF